MPSFSDFTNVLPDPTHKIGASGQLDATGQGVGWAEVSLMSVHNTQVSKTNAAKREAIAGLDHTWEVEIAYNKLTCAQFHPVFSFLLYRQTSLQPFYVSLPQHQPFFPTTGTLDGDHSRGDSIILLDIIDDISFNPGTLIYEDSADHTKIYMVTRVETSFGYFAGYGDPGTDKQRIHISPGLQRDVSSGATFTSEAPLMKVVQSGDIQETSLDTDGLFSYSIKLEEVTT